MWNFNKPPTRHKLPLFIVGTSGFAKEVELLALNCGHTKIYYISSDYKEVGKKVGQSFVKYCDETFFEHENPGTVEYIIGIGRPKIRKIIAERYKNFHSPSLIHPGVDTKYNKVAIGEGNIVTAGVQFTTDISIDDHNVFNLNMTVGHDAVIGSYNVFNPSVNISGGVMIEECTLIGTGAQVLENLKIAPNTTIGAGAVVTKNITEPNQIFVGMPAKQLKPKA